MERWFDLHLYLANWGSRRLMIRLPDADGRSAISSTPSSERSIAPRYTVVGENLILDIVLDEVEFEDLG